MYKDYVKEKESLETYENEHGFCAFNISSVARIMDIGDFYVKPEHRKDNVKSESLFNEIVDLAREKGCKKITACVDITQNNTELSVGALLKVKFRISHLDEENIYFYQNI